MKLKRLLLLWAALLLSPLLYADVCVTDGAVAPATGGAAVGSLSLNNPGSQVGDLLLAQVVVSNQGVNVSPPTGWTRYSEVGTGGGRGVYQGIFYRVATANEANTYTFSWNGGNRATGGLLVLRGVALVAGVPQLSVQTSSGFDSNLVAPSVMVAEANSRVLRFFAFGAGNTAISAPALEHYSSATTQAGPNGVVAAASSLLQGSIGASGTATATVPSSSDDWVATTLVSRPDPNSNASCGGTTGVHHYRLSFASNQALTCNPLDVQVSACQDSTCSQLNTAAVSLAPDPASGWSGATAFSGGTTQLQFRRTTPGSVALGMGGNPAATNPVQCFVAGVLGSCTVNFVESGFIFDVPNTLAAKPTPATLRAVRKDDQTQACVPGFASGTRTVQFSRLYSDPGTGTQPVVVNGEAVTTNTPVTLNFDASASAPLLVRYDDAGLMTLSASFSGSGQEAGLLLVGSDNFVSKPYGLLLETDTLSSCTADINCPLYPAGVRAGDAFSLRIKAVAWQSDGEPLTAAALADNPVTPNFTLSNITLASELVAPIPGSAGDLTPNTYNHPVGNQASISAAISEVGVFRLIATPSLSYHGETVAGGTSGLVGRFAPAFLRASGSANLAPSCGSFSYQGQSISFNPGNEPALVISGRNRQDETTLNYDRGAFWRFMAPPARATQASDLPYLSVVAADGRNPFSPLVPNADLNRRLEMQGEHLAHTDDLVQGDGEKRFRWVGESVAYRPAAVPQAEDLKFDALIQMGFEAADLTDEDDVCYGNGISCSDLSVTFGGSEVRLGRLHIGNAHGSELQALNLPVTVQSWQATAGGNAFMTEGLDNCSAALLGAPVMSGYTGNLTTGETTASLSGPLAGVGMLGLTAPGAGNDGSLRASFAAPTWLFYDWQGSGREMAQGLATFGIYRGSPPLIFRRELYRQ